MTIEVDDASGHQVAETTTWDSGGYQIPLSPGSYKVTAIINNQIVNRQNITVGSDNVEVDFDSPRGVGFLQRPATRPRSRFET